MLFVFVTSFFIEALIHKLLHVYNDNHHFQHHVDYHAGKLHEYRWYWIVVPIYLVSPLISLCVAKYFFVHAMIHIINSPNNLHIQHHRNHNNWFFIL